MQLHSAESIFRALNDAEVKYLVVGGLAVVAHGYARMTADIDLVIGLERENILKGLAALHAIGYRMAVPVTPEQFADPDQRERWRKEKGVLVLKMWSDAHRRTPIDVFAYEPFDMDEEWEKAPRVDWADDLKVPVVSLDTLLNMKRAAGRPQDVADLSVLEERQTS